MHDLLLAGTFLKPDCCGQYTALIVSSNSLAWMTGNTRISGDFL
jgi:hypothetical protein